MTHRIGIDPTIFDYARSSLMTSRPLRHPEKPPVLEDGLADGVGPSPELFEIAREQPVVTRPVGRGVEPGLPSEAPLTTLERTAPTMGASRNNGGLTAGALQFHRQSGGTGMPFLSDPTAMVNDAFNRLSGPELSRWVETNTYFKRDDAIGVQNADAIARAVMKVDQTKLGQLDYDALDQAGVALTEGLLAVDSESWAARTSSDRQTAIDTQRAAFAARKAADAEKARPEREARGSVSAEAAAAFTAQMLVEAEGAAPSGDAQFDQARSALEAVLSGAPDAWKTTGNFQGRLSNTFGVGGQEVSMSFAPNTGRMTFASNDMTYTLEPGAPGYAHLFALANQIYQRSQLPEGDPQRLEAKSTVLY